MGLISALLTIIVFVAVVGGITWLLIDFMCDGKITQKVAIYKNRNLLRECRKCERLYRKYQIDLVVEAKGRKDCPHCGNYIYDRLDINDPDKWMDTHTDCPKINLPTYLKILRAMKNVKKLNKEKASIERFEKYNNMKVDVDWIIKLQKDLSK